MDKYEKLNKLGHDLFWALITGVLASSFMIAVEGKEDKMSIMYIIWFVLGIVLLIYAITILKTKE